MYCAQVDTSTALHSMAGSRVSAGWAPKPREVGKAAFVSVWQGAHGTGHHSLCCRWGK